jgi:hypothetical protein
MPKAARLIELRANTMLRNALMGRRRVTATETGPRVVEAEASDAVVPVRWNASPAAAPELERDDVAHDEADPGHEQRDDGRPSGGGLPDEHGLGRHGQSGRVEHGEREEAERPEPGEHGRSCHRNGVANLGCRA